MTSFLPSPLSAPIEIHTLHTTVDWTCCQMLRSCVVAVIICLMMINTRADNVDGTRHQIVIIGDNVSFYCRSNSSDDIIRWDYQAPSTSQQPTQQSVHISDGARINPNLTRYKLINNTSDRRSVLEISSVRSTDAGTFVCTKSGSGVASFQAVLTVLNAEPECSVGAKLSSSTYGTNDAAVTCRVNYTGDWSPSFQCTPPSPSEHVFVEHVSSQSVTHRQRLSLNTTDAGNVTVTCRMYFNITLDSLTRADDKHALYAKKAEYSWSTQAVMCPLHNSAIPDQTRTSVVVAPMWIYLYIIITCQVILVQTVLLIICSRKNKTTLFKRLNSESSSSTVSSLSSPMGSPYSAVEYFSFPVQDTFNDLSPTDSIRDSPDDDGANVSPVYAEISASIRPCSLSVTSNITSISSVPASSHYASIRHQATRISKTKSFA